MPRRRRLLPEEVAAIVADLRRLDIYKTGTSLASRAAYALERLAAENKALRRENEGLRKCPSAKPTGNGIARSLSAAR
jgi:hypothetical protein